MQFDLPSFLVCPKDFIASTAHWTDQEVGAYWRLLMHQWLTGEIPDPSTNRGRRQMLRIIDSFESSWSTVQEKFPGATDGRLQNCRLERSRDRAITAHAAAVARGKKGASVKARNAARNLVELQDQPEDELPVQLEDQLEDEPDLHLETVSSIQNQSQNKNQNQSTTTKTRARDDLDPEISEGLKRARERHQDPSNYPTHRSHISSSLSRAVKALIADLPESQRENLSKQLAECETVDQVMRLGDELEQAIEADHA